MTATNDQLEAEINNLKATAATVEELTINYTSPLRFVSGSPQNIVTKSMTNSIDDVVFVAPYACELVAADYLRQYTGGTGPVGDLTINLNKHSSGGVLAGAIVSKNSPADGEIVAGSTWTFDTEPFDASHKLLAKGDQVRLEHVLNSSDATVRFPIALTMRVKPL